MLRHEAGFIVTNRVVVTPQFGIRFGDVIFGEPTLMDGGMYPASGGIYVLLTPDPTWTPRPFQPLYFGEFGIAGELQISPEKQLRCLRVAAGRNLFIAAHAMPLRQGSHFGSLKTDLIRQYAPIGNLEFAQEGVESATRIQDLEKKITEHEVVLSLVLTAIGQSAQKQPESRKRPIGFRPSRTGCGV